ncbi:MAG: hypothetical protein AB3P11_03935 [Wolbachia pipientis]
MKPIMIYSKIYQEYEKGEEFKWTEALMHGLIGAVSVGSGLLAGKTIFTNRGAVPTNLENATVEQLNVQQTLPFCT